MGFKIHGLIITSNRVSPHEHEIDTIKGQGAHAPLERKCRPGLVLKHLKSQSQQKQYSVQVSEIA